LCRTAKSNISRWTIISIAVWFCDPLLPVFRAGARTRDIVHHRMGRTVAATRRPSLAYATLNNARIGNNSHGSGPNGRASPTRTSSYFLGTPRASTTQHAPFAACPRTPLLLALAHAAPPFFLCYSHTPMRHHFRACLARAARASSPGCSGWHRSSSRSGGFIGSRRHLCHSGARHATATPTLHFHRAAASWRALLARFALRRYRRREHSSARLLSLSNSKWR